MKKSDQLSQQTGLVYETGTAFIVFILKIFI